MFVDEATLKTLTAEGKMPDSMGFVGLWKIVVVKNLPFSDLRRVGKIPNLLSHRLFTSASLIPYSSWSTSCGERVTNMQFPITMTGIVCGKKFPKTRSLASTIILLLIQARS